MKNIKGIKAVSGETKDLSKNDNRKVQVFYDAEENKVFCELHIGNSWSEFRNNDSIVDCGFFFAPATMKEIERRVEDSIREKEENDKILDELYG